jgi:hypothetical protein
LFKKIEAEAGVGEATESSAEASGSLVPEQEGQVLQLFNK